MDHMVDKSIEHAFNNLRRDEPNKEHVKPLGSGKSYYSQPEKPLHRMLNRFQRVHQNLEGNRRQYSQNFKLRMLKNTRRKGY